MLHAARHAFTHDTLEEAITPPFWLQEAGADDINARKAANAYARFSSL